MNDDDHGAQNRGQEDSHTHRHLSACAVIKSKHAWVNGDSILICGKFDANSFLRTHVQDKLSLRNAFVKFHVIVRTKPHINIVYT